MRTAAKTAVLVVLGLLVAVGVALWSFDHDSRTVVIGAHTTTVSPTFDGHATFDFGPLLPRARIPTDEPANLGVTIDVGDTEAASVNQLIVNDAVIASQPTGEIDKVTRTVQQMLRSAIMRGTGVGLLSVLAAVVAWKAIGVERRHEVASSVRALRHPNRSTLPPAGAVALAAVVGIALVVWPQSTTPESASSAKGWIPLRNVFPEIDRDPVLDRVSVSRGSATDAGLAVVDSAISTYQKSVRFYGQLAGRVPATAAQLHQPADTEKVAVIVSDRHDNIGMDPVAAAVAKAGKATMVIDAGDDTSTGGSWEAFSLNSLGRQFEGLQKVGIAGNHDTGPFEKKALQAAGFTLLAGRPTTVGGIRFLGDSDPRSSGLTAAVVTKGKNTIEAQDDRMTKAACADKNVSTVVVHSPSAATKLASSGCVDLVISGHLHRQVGPTTTTAADGRRTVSFTNASTGGAVYAFALGSKLRREAQVTLVTYRDGRPIGLQPVNFEPGGAIEVQPYAPLDLTTDEVAPSG